MTEIARMAHRQAAHLEVRHGNRHSALCGFPDLNGLKVHVLHYDAAGNSRHIQPVQAHGSAERRFPVTMILGVEMAGENDICGNREWRVTAGIRRTVRIQKNAGATGRGQQKCCMTEPGNLESSFHIF